MAKTKAHKTASSSPATKSTKTSKTTKTTKTNKPVKTATSTKSVKATTARPETTTATNQPAKKKNFAKVILWIISLLALAAVLTAIIVCVVNKNNDSSLTVETGKGNKIETVYVGLNDNKFRLKVPKDYKVLSDKEIKDKYGSEAPNVVYASPDDKINVVIKTTQNALSNDQIKEYLDTMKSILGLGGEVIDTDYYQVDNYNVGTIRLTSNSAEGNYYNHMMFFSQDGKLVIVTFNCPKDLREEYEPVGNFIIKSLNFNV